jgi:hypothetical protein
MNMIAQVVWWAACMLAGAQQTSTLPSGGPPESKGQRIIGEVQSVGQKGLRLSIRSDDGNTATVLLHEQTPVLRVPPGETSLERAEKIAAGKISTGDRVLARGRWSDDQKSFSATTVIVIARGELERKHERERLQWTERGIAGVVAALEPAGHRINVRVLSLSGTRSMSVEAAGQVAFRRYPPDSASFADAVPSSFEDLQVGDQIRVLGQKSADGSRIQAEQIVSGRFRSFSATVNSVDRAAGEVRVKDLETGRPVIVAVTPETSARRLSPMMASMLGRRMRGEQVGPNAPRGSPGAQLTAGSPQGRGTPGPDGGPVAGKSGADDFHQLLDRMPGLTLDELKPGETLVISCSAGKEAPRVKAIGLLAGVEPLLSALSGNADLSGVWNLTADVGLP